MDTSKKESSSPKSPKHCPRKNEIPLQPRKYKLQRSEIINPSGSSSSGIHRYNQVVSIMVSGGIIELVGVWDESGENDGFDPFLKNSVREGGTFATRAGLFKLAERRGLPGSLYSYLPSPQKKRKRNGDPFPRHWYMRLVKEGQDSIEVRKRVLQSVAHFLKKSETKDRFARIKAKAQDRENKGSSDTTQTLENHYVVPDHWDLTPPDREPLDHYVTDEAVATAILASMSLEGPTAQQTFGAMYGEDAKHFFSGPPYCQIAVTEFGYSNPHDFDPEPNQDITQPHVSEREDHHHQLDDYFGNCSD